MKKPGRVIGLSLLGIAVLTTFFFLWKKSQPEIIRYEIVSPIKGSIENKAVATGKIDPRDEVLIKPQISGIISEVLKEAGQSVKAGEVIAKIKVIPEMVQLSQAESRVRLGAIAFEQAEKTFKRQQQLFDKGVISKEEFEKSTVDYKKAQEEKDNSVEALELIQEGISQKMVSASNTQVRATINGTVLDVPIKVGNSVIQANTFNEGTTIASIANMGDMIFKGKIDETEVGKISEGMSVNLTIGALENLTFDADLEYIAPKGVEENGAIMFEIKAAAKIPQGTKIRAGYSANAAIVINQAKDVMVIPEGCLELNKDSVFVYLLTAEKPEQTFEKREIKIGLSDGINVEILSGLSLTDKIRGSVIDPKAKK